MENLTACGRPFGEGQTEPPKAGKWIMDQYRESIYKDSELIEAIKSTCTLAKEIAVNGEELAAMIVQAMPASSFPGISNADTLILVTEAVHKEMNHG